MINNKIKIEHINTLDMLADPLTKNLHGIQMADFTNKILIFIFKFSN